MQVGGSARKTNTDYTEGKLPELIDIIIESGTSGSSLPATAILTWRERVFRGI
jgi:hypothetical protein